MEERKESNKKELLSFKNNSNDYYMDEYLLDFLVDVKNLGVTYQDPYFPKIFIEDCLEKMKKYMNERGTLKL
ncbi:MAG: hypothetical protein COA31_005460 [Flavobacteriales bacterium]|nr:hypothetical protein [Flavobacteriales bacterium]